MFFIISTKKIQLQKIFSFIRLNKEIFIILGNINRFLSWITSKSMTSEFAFKEIIVIKKCSAQMETAFFSYISINHSLKKFQLILYKKKQRNRKKNQIPLSLVFPQNLLIFPIYAILMKTNEVGAWQMAESDAFFGSVERFKEICSNFEKSNTNG